MQVYEKYYKTFMGMKKAEIINEGVTLGVWANREGNKVALMKWKKWELAGHLAGRLNRLEKLGY